ncbi:MAG: ATP-dependent helicase HrpB [Thermodesulfobacteriota bacterium]
MKILPIDHILQDLKDAVLNHHGVVLQAPPGSGKTTRVPPALLELFPPEKGRILLLEPRRLAAVSAARWMAQERGEKVGQTLGYSIRFESCLSNRTRIEVVTEGILTRRLNKQPSLDGVGMVIFDEFHERSLQTDLALALCLDIQRSIRKDLKILVMSATMDCRPIAALLGEAPILSISGESFPVKEYYLPQNKSMPLEQRITMAVSKALQETPGDILVFLSGAGEIRRSAEPLDHLAKSRKGDFTVHPLYGDLPFKEQEKAILPLKKRKVVLATNLAETSLTIEGVGVVIDSGQARRLRYDPRTGMNRWLTVTISQASAEQRKGRAGRLGPGVCYRLYSRHEYESMQPFTPPEILSLDLTSLVLELIDWGVKDPSALSWLDSPPKAAWEAGKELLTKLGALNYSGILTSSGREMAALPLHPRISRLLLKAHDLDLPQVGADLAALLSERDILRPGFSAGRSLRKEADIGERLQILQEWRRDKSLPPGVDPWAIGTVDRLSRELEKILNRPSVPQSPQDPILISRILLNAFPDRIAKKREEGVGRFLLAQGPGIRMPESDPLSRSPYLIVVQADFGEGSEGKVRLAEPVSESIIREELEWCIKRLRRVEWEKKKGAIVATVEERLDALTLSVRPFSPSDEETVPILCEAIRTGSASLAFTPEVRQLQGRVDLMRRAFPEEDWPDWSEAALLIKPEEWLSPFLSGLRSREQLNKLDIHLPLLTQLPFERKNQLEKRTPQAITVPSGHRILLDYASGEFPILAVKLQEMFGQSDTPTVAGGRVKVLIHLLSPAGRPVQVTQDLKRFWSEVYPQVKKELKGRYPKHPWPDDPWKAVPTRQVKRKKK